MMHILAILGSIITILYMLDRLGVDIGWLNPFHWRHRRKWANKFESDPIYSVEDPLHIAALLVIGTAKLDGEVSAETREAALQQFQTNFKMSEAEAADLWTAATHLLGGPQVIDAQLEGVVSRNRQRLSSEQVQSLLDMVHQVAVVNGELSASQQSFIAGLAESFEVPRQEGGTWN